LKSSNTSRDGGAIPLWLWRWFSAALVFVCFPTAADALSSSKAISQYLRDNWGVEQGYPGGLVYAFAQTPDGFLWIGTEKGLVRFDGLSFRLFQHSDVAIIPEGPAVGLAVDAEGSLWIRMQQPSLLRYRDRTFQDLLPELPITEPDITAMCIGENGELVLTGLANGMVRYSKGRFVAIKPAGQPPGLVISMAETGDNKLWVGTREQGVYYLSEGQSFSIAQGLPDKKINSLFPVDKHELWVGTDNGVVRWNGTELSPVGVPHGRSHLQVFVVLKDRDANMWIGTSDGLMRIDARGRSSPEARTASTQSVTALFEDREGNLWVGISRGIERLRDSAFTTYSVASGLLSGSDGPVYVDSQGRTWFAPSSGGLYWLEEGKVGGVTVAGLDKDIVYSISGGKDELWLGRQQGGLTHLLSKDSGDAFETETFTKNEGLVQNSVFAVEETRDGGVWAGTISGGLNWFRRGSSKTYTTRDGLASNSISSIFEGSDGTMWFGTPNGLSAFSNGQWRNYSSREGLPPGTVNCLIQDSTGVLWIGTANGLAFLRSGAIQTPREVPEALHQPILGMAEDRSDSLWVSTSDHVLRINREKLLLDDLGDGDVREYGLADGLESMHGVKRHRSVAGDSLGRIWFSMNGGLSFVEPKAMTIDSAPAIVHVEGILADGRAIPLDTRTHIPSPHQRITLSYTGLSLSVPARVRFRYRLDGFDQGWSEPTATRETSYTNLDSGTYLFHVKASNSDGLWNSAESTFQFEIDPMFWQTWWFRLSVLLAVAMVVLAFFRLRVGTLTRQMNVRFEERLAERTRIAQELHDTLLQGVLSASMQLHVAAEHLPEQSPAKPLVGRVLELMTRVIDDGRNTLRGLRSHETASQNLEETFLRIQQDLGIPTHTGFRILVEGTPRPLRAAICDDLYFIGREALTNAFRHSGAAHIEMEIEYEVSHLQILVRDNGCGIDQHVLSAGREGHWGLSGMRERAERIGARFRVLSRANAGTEVELLIPGRVAFVQETSGRRPSWISWLDRGQAAEKKTEIESGQPK
jgi:ligand-binding sensor domain-containing protein/signal transduction histidine kinase